MSLDEKIAKAMRLGCKKMTCEPHEGRYKVFVRGEKPEQPIGMSFGSFIGATEKAFDEFIAKAEGSEYEDPEAEALL